MSNELIKCLPITNPGLADSKLPGDFMVRSIKREPGILGDSVLHVKLEISLKWMYRVDAFEFNRLRIPIKLFKKTVATLCCHKIW